jgi:hypothetical protein
LALHGHTHAEASFVGPATLLRLAVITHPSLPALGLASVLEVPFMCRSIKTLRPPYAEDVGPEDVHAAALQYVRKIAGMRAPAKHNAEAFDRAVAEVAIATERLLGSISIKVPARA